MTMMKNGTYGASTTRFEVASMPALADEWDIETRGVRRCGAEHVRTLSNSIMAVDVGRGDPAQWPDRADDRFESHREKRESVLVGLGLSAALVIGSIVGGAFSDDTASMSHQVSAQYVAGAR